MALAQIETARPQIAVLDIDLPKLDGLGVARELARREIPIDILFLTIHADEDIFQAAMDPGSKGYILKESTLGEIVQALRIVSTGQYYVSPPLMASPACRSRVPTADCIMPGTSFIGSG